MRKWSTLYPHHTHVFSLCVLSCRAKIGVGEHCPCPCNGRLRTGHSLVGHSLVSAAGRLLGFQLGRLARTWLWVISFNERYWLYFIDNLICFAHKLSELTLHVKVRKVGGECGKWVWFLFRKRLPFLGCTRGTTFELLKLLMCGGVKRATPFTEVTK